MSNGLSGFFEFFIVLAFAAGWWVLEWKWPREFYDRTPLKMGGLPLDRSIVNRAPYNSDLEVALFLTVSRDRRNANKKVTGQ